MSQKIIWHLVGYSENYGDCVLQTATQKIIKEKYDKSIEFVFIDNQKTYFSPMLIDKMNNETDMLLIGGGGFIFRREEDKSKSGWQFNIDEKNIEKIKVPIVVYGIGHNKFPYDESNFSLHTWNHIQRTINKSELFSVRNKGTYDKLIEYGLNVDKVEMVPDSGMFIKAEEFGHKIFTNNNVKIGVNWATDRPLERFSNWKEYINKLKVIIDVCKWAIEKYNAKIYWIEHLMPKNQEHINRKEMIRNKVKKYLGGSVYIIYDELKEELYPPFNYLVGFFANIYKKMNVVLGMRGHANIIAFGQNAPIIGIGQHKKVEWFLKDCDLKESLVKLNDVSDAKDRMRLKIKLIKALNKKEMYSIMEKEFKRQTEIKDRFIDKIIKLL